MEIASGLPSLANALAVLGSRAVDAMNRLLVPAQGSLFWPLDSQDDDGALSGLIRALIDPVAKWSDEQATLLLEGCAERKSAGYRIDFALITRWVANHPNDANSVLQCLDVEPPDEVEIIRVLSRAGSQKVVFLASWRSMQKEVVLKRVIRGDGTAVREMESFPLNLSHPNIIETYPLRNSKGEVFFAEVRLAEVLSDGWRAAGIHDGANLLYDIGLALKNIHENRRVHGDVKPDNIGKNAGEFILLDFGICRPTNEFAGELTATGSLRTRCPELLTGQGYVDPPKVDVWALGATIFNVHCGRFPLIQGDERVPRVSVPSEREKFEKILRHRAEAEWDKWVDTSILPEVFRSIVKDMLERDPAKRISSAKIVERAGKELPAFIRGLVGEPAPSQRFSPLEELFQLSAFINSTPIKVIPKHKLAEFAERLSGLQGTPGFSHKEYKMIQDLFVRLGSSDL